MRRIPWDILFTLLLGFGFGLAYAWLIHPLNVNNSNPNTLRNDFKDEYRSAIAAAFAATGNLPRAQARLTLLGDPDPIEALNSQAQRLTAANEFAKADQLVQLATDLEKGTVLLPVPTSNTEAPTSTAEENTVTLPPPPQELPFQFTETPQAIDTQAVETQFVVVNTPTPRPSQTPIPTISVPFALVAQDTVCDTNLPDGLLQVMVFNSKHRQVPGATLIITWDNGQEQFFTGFKPEIGNGYADYIMTPNVTYTLRIASGSDIAYDLSAPTCQTPSGESYYGGVKLTFQQP